jgi:hypothetical protein
VRVEGETAAGDPELEKIAVEAGRFALFEKQDVRDGETEGHRPEREAQPPGDMKETEQDQDHLDGEGGRGDDGHKEIAVETPNRSGGIIRGIGVCESQFVHGWSEGAEMLRTVPKGLERRRESRPAEVENGEKSAHDGGGPGDDDAGDDAHLAVGVALADGVGAGPDFDDAPEESEHEEDSEGGAKALLEAAGRAAGGLGEDRKKAERLAREDGNQ